MVNLSVSNVYVWDMFQSIVETMTIISKTTMDSTVADTIKVDTMDITNTVAITTIAATINKEINDSRLYIKNILTTTAVTKRTHTT